MKSLRVYFNVHGKLPWCVHDGETEHAVAHVALVQVPGRTHYEPDTPRLPDHSGPPCAWLEVLGELRIEDGVAVVTRG